MADKWGRANPQMPDPHQHYPRHYSPAGMVDEIAAWHEEHERWLAAPWSGDLGREALAGQALGLFGLSLFGGQPWSLIQRSDGVIEVGEGGIDIAKELEAMCDNATVRVGRAAYAGYVIYTIKRDGTVEVHEPPGHEAVVENGRIVAVRPVLQAEGSKE